MIDKRERVYQAFGTFLADYVRDLNNRSAEGWSVLVEGQRDLSAIRKLGYIGPLVTVSAVGRNGTGILGRIKGVVILTDLDREGTVLAAKFVRRFYQDGIPASLSERRRLKAASRGVFLHIENLGRFASPEAFRWAEVGGADPEHSQAKANGQRLRSRKRHPRQAPAD